MAPQEPCSRTMERKAEIDHPSRASVVLSSAVPHALPLLVASASLPAS